VVLKLMACVLLARKSADDARISFGAEKIKELVVTSNKLTTAFAEKDKSGLGPYVARGQSV
jgi:hypothetical protein